MIEGIKDLLARKRMIEAERTDLQRQLDDKRYKSKEQIRERLDKLDRQLLLISAWMSLLQEDESYVIQRHLIDGIDWPRVKVGFDEKWGEEYGKTVRTLKSYQRNALAKICKFVESQHRSTGVDLADIIK